jgi:dipeptidyl aminopeptidase/acylaminoacyl peptidase
MTTHNKAVMEQIDLGAVEDISFPSADGTEIHGLMIKPPDYHPGQLYPTLLWIHGGPNSQDAHGFDIDRGQMVRQWFAAHGYVVLGVNYRGSSGRGDDFARAIVADWGNKEVADVLAAVDHVVALKIADPTRLGIGGWSYGGITTDYVIASDMRFKAAVSGAGAGNWLGLYGVDEYVLQYNEELGMPWRNPELYMKLSYPFLHADRIKTPTLFLGGTKDADVPLVGGEQMFEALKTLKIDSELVVYPDEYHILRRPSFVRDRLERMVAWYDRYLSAK